MRFYEPLVLLLAATNSCIHNLAPKNPEPSPVRWSQTLDQLFHDFMNKLAQICDSQSGGRMVTAVVALSLPDRVQYRFASNQRSQEELDQMRMFVTEVLETLRDWTEESTLPVKARILGRVMAFTRPRLRKYINAVATFSAACLETQGLSPEVITKLRKLHETSSEADAVEKADDEADEEVLYEETCESWCHPPRLWLERTRLLIATTSLPKVHHPHDDHPRTIQIQYL